MSDVTEHIIFVRRVPWYVRLWRFVSFADRRGAGSNGTADKPHHTLKRAMCDVPMIVPQHTIYTIDLTGYSEP